MVGSEAALEIRVLIGTGRAFARSRVSWGSRATRCGVICAARRRPRYKPRATRPTKLDPFKDYIAERLDAAAPERIPATVLLRELRERGYAGG